MPWLDTIDELNDNLDLNLVTENYNTIGVFLVSLLGCIPKKNESKTIQYGNVTFKIEEVKERWIGKLKYAYKKRLLVKQAKGI